MIRLVVIVYLRLSQEARGSRNSRRTTAAPADQSRTISHTSSKRPAK
jgi:hypothetical protein